MQVTKRLPTTIDPCESLRLTATRIFFIAAGLRSASTNLSLHIDVVQLAAIAQDDLARTGKIEHAFVMKL